MKQQTRRMWAVALSTSLIAQSALPLLAADRDKTSNDRNTTSPIKHVIVLIGENRTFDHVFATYVPRGEDTVSNLLSKRIINADGTPGPRFDRAAQQEATAPFRTEYYSSLPANEKAPYTTLPAPTLNFAPTATIFPPGTPNAFLATVEPSLSFADLKLLTTGAATGFSQTFVQPDPDTRVQNFNTLPNGPFPLQGTALPYDSYTGDTTHRLFEMCSSPIATWPRRRAATPRAA